MGRTNDYELHSVFPMCPSPLVLETCRRVKVKRREGETLLATFHLLLFFLELTNPHWMCVKQDTNSNTQSTVFVFVFLVHSRQPFSVHVDTSHSWLWSGDPDTQCSIFARLFSVEMYQPELSMGWTDGEVGLVCIKAL